MMRGIAVASALACMAAPAQAQLAGRLSLGGGASTSQLAITSGGATTTLTGPTLLGSGRVAFGRFSISGLYRQGTLKPDSGVSQDLVEGYLMAEAHPLPWLTVGAGPHALAFEVNGSIEQWKFIEARVRAGDDIIANRVSAHVQVWDALSASSNAPGGGASGRGGEAGITFHFPRSPVWARLLYTVDRAAVTGRTETLEDVSLSVGFGWH